MIYAMEHLPSAIKNDSSAIVHCDGRTPACSCVLITLLLHPKRYLKQAKSPFSGNFVPQSP